MRCVCEARIVLTATYFKLNKNALCLVLNYYTLTGDYVILEAFSPHSKEIVISLRNVTLYIRAAVMRYFIVLNFSS